MNHCPICGSTKIVRVDPNSLKFAAPSHSCEACGAELLGSLGWRNALSTLAIGLFLMSLGFAAFEASKSIAAIAPPLRFVAFLAVLGGVFGFCANRVLQAIELRPWQPKPEAQCGQRGD
jgi:hypothetical protein